MRLQEKIQKRGSARGFNMVEWWYMENATSIISEGINSLHSEKNTGDSSHQALIKFSFSEFFIF